MEHLMDLTKSLTDIDGISGDESRVRDFIIEHIKDYCDYHVDPLGNLIAFKKGATTPQNKVMVAAHMDEVGFIVTGIDESGMLRFENVGGIDTRTLLGKRVRIGEIVGVIGYVPIHLTKGAKDDIPDPKILRIDVAAKDKEDALKHIQIGDGAVFDSDYREFGDGLIKAKALDDRIGCAIMIKMIQSSLKFDMYFAFNVQEEVGCRGAVTSTYSIDPDYAIVIEATTAADIAGVETGNKVCELGKGPVISIADRGTAYDRKVVQKGFATAKEIGVLVQPKQSVAGGNDASVIHMSRGGVKTIAVSMPCRYIHSPVNVLKKGDIENAHKLIGALSDEFAQMDD